MKAPFIGYVSIGSEALPLLAGIANRGALDSARVWTMFWCAYYFVLNVAGAYIGSRGINNHFISYVEILFAAPAILWALSLWQLKPMAKLTLRLIIPAFVVAWTLLMFVVEDITNFSPVAEPVYSMLVLGAALYTLLSRGLQESQPLLRRDWFWVCVGLSLHLIPLIVINPLSAAYVRSDPGLVVRAFMIKFYVNITAFVAIAIGMLCPRTTPSGLSFSPRSSV